MDATMVLLFLCVLVIGQSPSRENLVAADECGTRFTDFTSSAFLAQIVLKGAIKDFNQASLHSQVRSANVTIQKVYKGMDVLKEFNRSMEEGDDVIVHHFGVEDRDNCVAPDSEEYKGRDKVFFLRQTSHRGMLRLSAMPVDARNSMDGRVRRSLCDTCLRPPEIRRVVCQDCAKEPTIRAMKSKKTKIGRRARLRCLARGRPAPTITWNRGNVPIVSGTGGITIRTSGTTSLLVFSSVTNAHSGRYKCTATNEVGQAEEIVTLNVMARGSQPAYTIDSAPDRIPCQRNLCLNGGSCIFSPSLDLRRCICTPGFEGVQCENIDSSTLEVNNQYFNRVPAVPAPDANTNDGSRRNISTGTINVPSLDQNPTSKSTTATTTTTSTTQQTTRSPVAQTKTTRLQAPTTRLTGSPVAAGGSGRNRFVPRPRLPVTSQKTGQILPGYPVSRKSNLKSIPCQEKNYCQNRGKCRFIRKLNRKYCKCRSGFTGLRCEMTV